MEKNKRECYYGNCNEAPEIGHDCKCIKLINTSKRLFWQDLDITDITEVEIIGKDTFLVTTKDKVYFLQIKQNE